MTQVSHLKLGRLDSQSLGPFGDTWPQPLKAAGAVPIDDGGFTGLNIRTGHQEPPPFQTNGFSVIDDSKSVAAAEVQEAFSINKLLGHWLVSQEFLLRQLPIDPVTFRGKKVLQLIRCDVAGRPEAQRSVRLDGQSRLPSRIVRVYGNAHVWDISQTDGEPVPEPPRPELLEGEAPEGLWDGLADQIVARGFELRLVSNARSIGGANGLTDYLTHEVSVRMDMDDAAQVKTLAHELGHVMLHGPDNVDAAMHRGIAEVEAESIALMVGAAHGLDTTTYTVPYVSTWASDVPGKSPVEVVQATADRVRAASLTVLDKLPTSKVGDGNPPGLDRDALSTQRAPQSVTGPTRTHVDVLGR